MVKFSKFCSKRFTASPMDVVVLKCRKKIFLREIVKIVRYLTDTKNSSSFQTDCYSNTVWIAPKICQSQPATLGSQNSKFHPNRFTFGERLKAVFYPIEYVHARLFEPIITLYMYYCASIPYLITNMWLHCLGICH